GDRLQRLERDRPDGRARPHADDLPPAGVERLPPRRAGALGRNHRLKCQGPALSGAPADASGALALALFFGSESGLGLRQGCCSAVCTGVSVTVAPRETLT